MATSYDPVAVLAVIAVIGVATFAIRFSFIGLFGYVDEIPPRLQRGLRYVPAAVLAALVLPALVIVGPEGALEGDKLLAGAVAFGVAWRTEDILATMAAGMGAIWLLQLVP
jgi:branched-subunit amino acid transport protein